MFPHESMVLSIEISGAEVTDSRRSSVPASMPWSGDRNSCETEDMKSDFACERADVSNLKTSAIIELPKADK